MIKKIILFSVVTFVSVFAFSETSAQKESRCECFVQGSCNRIKDLLSDEQMKECKEQLNFLKGPTRTTETKAKCIEHSTACCESAQRSILGLDGVEITYNGEKIQVACKPDLKIQKDLIEHMTPKDVSNYMEVFSNCDAIKKDITDAKAQKVALKKEGCEKLQKTRKALVEKYKTRTYLIEMLNEYK